MPALVESHPEPILSIHWDGEIHFANPATRSYFPDLEDRATEHPLFQEVFAKAKELQEKGGSWGTYILAHANQTYRVVIRVSASGSPFQVSIIDLTREALLQKQVFEAQKWELISNLTCGVAHDFNNYLSVILTLAELITSTHSDNSELVQDLEEIKQSAKDAAGLAQQLMYYGGKRREATEQSNPSDLIGTMQPLLKTAVGKQRVIQFHLAANLPDVTISPSELKQVVMNLVVNARDATPDGGRIVVETKLDSLSVPQSVVLTVTDSGTGISKKTLQKIFEPYFTTKGQGKGNGLGLAMCNEVIKRSGGQINVESELGKGTTFQIHLPVAKHDNAPVSSSGGSVNGITSKKTVLLADDDPQVIKALSRVLTSKGYDILTASDGEKAWRLLMESKGKVDLVLTDGIMPNLSGFDLAQKIQREIPNLPVLCITGSDESVISEQQKSNPKLIVLRKPLAGPELLAQIQNIIGGNV